MVPALGVPVLQFHPEGVAGNTEKHRQILTRCPFDCSSTGFARLRRTEVDELELITAITRSRDNAILGHRHVSLLNQLIAHRSSVPSTPVICRLPTGDHLDARSRTLRPESPSAQSFQPDG